MNKKPFTTTELVAPKAPVFKNGDHPANSRVLTKRDVSQSALNAVFKDRPSYFTALPSNLASR